MGSPLDLFACSCDEAPSVVVICRLLLTAFRGFELVIVQERSSGKWMYHDTSALREGRYLAPASSERSSLTASSRIRCGGPLRPTPVVHVARRPVPLLGGAFSKVASVDNRMQRPLPHRKAKLEPARWAPCPTPQYSPQATVKRLRSNVGKLEALGNRGLDAKVVRLIAKYSQVNNIIDRVPL